MGSLRRRDDGAVAAGGCGLILLFVLLCGAVGSVRAMSHGLVPRILPREAELLNSNFFQRMREMIMERAYEDALNEVPNEGVS